MGTGLGTGLGLQGSGGALHPVTRHKNLLDAACQRVAQHFLVKGQRLRPDFAHIAQQQQARRGQFGQPVDGGAHRVGVGVVAVVDQGLGLRAPVQGEGARAPGHGFETFEPGLDGRQRHPGGDGAGRGRQRVVQVVPSGQPQARLQRPGRGVQMQRPGAIGPVRLGVDLRRWGAGFCVGGDGGAGRAGPGFVSHTFRFLTPALPGPRRLGRYSCAHGEAQHLARTGDLLPQRAVGVVGREYRHAVGRQGRQHAAVLARHRFYAWHEFLVFALGVVDQRHRGLG